MLLVAAAAVLKEFNSSLFLVLSSFGLFRSMLFAFKTLVIVFIEFDGENGSFCHSHIEMKIFAMQLTDQKTGSEETFEGFYFTRTQLYQNKHSLLRT